MSLPEPGSATTALVTGASSGIGAEIARELAARGQNLTLVARREDRLRELADEIIAAHGVRVDVIACDLGEAAARAKLEMQIAELGLIVTILVNNAGFGYAGDFIAADAERQIAMVELNCGAVTDLLARFAPSMAERGDGAIINIASTGAFQPMPKSATYGATKAFVLSLSEAMHQELKGEGVSVTAVCPGPVRTEFGDAAGMGDVEDGVPDLLWSSPEEVASDAVKAADAGKRSVIPGRLNQASALLGRYSPRAMTLPLTERIWKQVE